MHTRMASAKKILTKTLHKIASKENLEVFDLKIKPVNTNGANFMSVIYRATLKSPSRELNLFAKLAILHKSVREHNPIELIYEKEALFYSTIAPTYEKIQQKHGIPVEERYKTPKYYGSHLEVNEETIVLEDMVSHGYSAYDRLVPITWEFASKSIEQLAKFHALSLAYENEYPEEFGRQFKRTDSNKSIDYQYKMTKQWMNITHVVPNNMRARLLRFVEENWRNELFLKFYGPSRLGFVVHGDFRASNVMYKLEDNKLTDLVPVDYQSLRLGSPCYDIIYFLYCGSDAEFRKKHMSPLLDHYYKTFSSFLKRLDMNPDKIFTKLQFEKEFTELLSFGLCTAILLLPSTLATGDNIPNVVDDGMSAFAKIKPNKIFKKRFKPILDEFIEQGLLK